MASKETRENSDWQLAQQGPLPVRRRMSGKQQGEYYQVAARHQGQQTKQHLIRGDESSPQITKEPESKNTPKRRRSRPFEDGTQSKLDSPSSSAPNSDRRGTEGRSSKRGKSEKTWKIFEDGDSNSPSSSATNSDR